MSATTPAPTSPPAAPAVTAPREACPLCGAPLDPQQDWCMRCGAAARTRLAAAPNWRAPVLAVAVIAALALGVLVAALVKLAADSGPTPAASTSILTSTAALGSAPGTTSTPASTSPALGLATTTTASTPTTAGTPAAGTPTSPDSTSPGATTPAQTTTGAGATVTQSAPRTPVVRSPKSHRPG